MRMNLKKHTFLLVFTVLMLLCSAVGVSAADLNEKWVDHRGNANHNAVVDTKLPTTMDDTILYWATSADPKANESNSPNWAYAPSHPILIDDTVVFFAKTEIFKMNAITGEIYQSGQLAAKSSWNITPPGYGDGKIFACQENGKLQAVDYETLEVLWSYQEKELKGQSNCPVMYRNINGTGYIYTGFWNAPSKDAYYVCVNADTGKEVWKYKNTGGFYWAGSYVTDKYLLIGSDDGMGDSFGSAGAGTEADQVINAKSGKVFSLDPVTGKQIDVFNIPGDVRCTICYDNGTAYFTTTAGYFYGVKVDANGKFDKSDYIEINLTEYLKSHDLKGNSAALRATGEDYKDGLSVLAADEVSKSTGTPVVHNGRAYIGTCAPNQFGEYSPGHGIAVLDLKAEEVAYFAPTGGSIQTSGLLTTAYEKSENGAVYVYFIENYQPGKIRYIKDTPGQTEFKRVDGNDKESYVDILITPSAKNEQYCIASLVCDDYGTMYYKNDSGFIMCIGNNIEKIELTKAPTKTTYEAGETFDPSGMEVTATYANGKTRDVTKYVTYNTNPLTENDTAINISFDHVSYRDADDGTDGNDSNKTGVVVNPLYIDKPISIQVEDNPATDVIAAIESLKGCITKDGVAKVEKAYAALDDAHKAMVTNYDDLKAAKAAVSKPIPFTDIPDSWYQDAVQFAFYNGLMNGTNAEGTTFEPNSSTTRAQLVTILYRYAGTPKVSGTTPFTDLDASQTWYHDAVKWAYQNKIVNGMSATAFAPNDEVTREQFATILYRYTGEYLGLDVSARAPLSKYNDARAVQSWAVESFQWTVAKGYISGYEDNTLRPAYSANRAVISTIMMRYAESMK